YPSLTDFKWFQNIEKGIQLRTPHISAYALTVEPRTALANAIRKGKELAIDDDQSANQFLTLNQQLTAAGFEHYEISNYSLPGCYAVHNTNYWKGIPYLGIGPSAHGFDGSKRYLNIANNSKYLTALLKNELAETMEELTVVDRFNEYIMTSLRTQWGIDLEKIETDFGQNYVAKTSLLASKFITQEQLVIKENKITLTPKGKLFADGIASALFADDE
ncbi:MAG: radical SAM family heme chaperone HemW, partial [Bacteroidia bacterium]